jgi:hypothetical protein
VTCRCVCTWLAAHDSTSSVNDLAHARSGFGTWNAHPISVFVCTFETSQGSQFKFVCEPGRRDRWLAEIEAYNASRLDELKTSKRLSASSACPKD